jgi:non-ribosomal peptide synthetase component E (peptide arylation enzyme)
MDETRADRFFKFVERHKVAITATVATTATLSFAIWVNKKATSDMLEFIKEHGLYEEYFNAVD